jgi:hypothetical protein
MEVRETAIRHGLSKKRKNALAALVCGALPAALMGYQFHPAGQAWLIGIALGLIWGNAFEYAYQASCCIDHARSTGPHIKSITRKSVLPRKQNS